MQLRFSGMSTVCSFTKSAQGDLRVRFLLLTPHKQNARVLIFALFVIGTTKNAFVRILFCLFGTTQNNSRVRFLVFVIGTTQKKCTGHFFVRTFFLIHTTSHRCECISEVLDTTREVLSVKRYARSPLLRNPQSARLPGNQIFVAQRLPMCQEQDGNNLIVNAPDGREGRGKKPVYDSDARQADGNAQASTHQKRKAVRPLSPVVTSQCCSDQRPPARGPVPV